MASESKLEAAEPVEGAVRMPGVGATEDGARGDDDAPSLEVAVDEGEAAADGKAEDEDVSVDELLISDELEDDEDEATDIHPPLSPDAEQAPAAAAASTASEDSASSDAADAEPTEQGEVPEEILAAPQPGRASAEEEPDAEIELVPSDPMASSAPASEVRVAASGAEALDTIAEEQAATSPEAVPRPLMREPEPSVPNAPLPSFDIPDLEVSARPAPRISTPIPPPRPSAPPPPVIPPLSELGEDDDDAVTHMGLPVPEATYAPPEASGFAPATPAVASLSDTDPGAAQLDARRAATRVIPRIDPALIAARAAQAQHAPSPGLAGWARSVDWRGKFSWALEHVLPPLSLVFLGSGIGAGIMLLQPSPAPVVMEPARASQTIHALEGAPVAKASSPLLASAEAGDAAALAQLDGMAPRERSAAMTLALEAGYRSQRTKELQALIETLDATPRNVPPETTAKLIEFATSPETMLPALEALAGLPGPQGPDLLYAVWEKAPGGSRAASVAQQLLQGADQRAKASPELLVALDLRSAQSCEDYAALLPAAKERGDKRSSATLEALRHRDGCGADGRSDCFRCLRRNADLLRAISAVKKRPAPEL